MAIITRARLNQYLESVSGGTAETDMHIQELLDFMGIVADRKSPTIVRLGTKSSEYSKNKIVCGDTDLVPRVVTVNGAVTNVATTVVLAAGHGNRVQQWQQLYNPATKEVMLVTTVPATDTLTVATRGSRGSANVAIVDQQVLQLMPPAVPEGVDGPRSPMSQGTLFDNFMMISEYTFQLSHRARVTKTFEFMDDRFNAELKRFMDISTLDWGKQILFGTRVEGDGGGTNPGSTGGLFVNSNVRVGDFATGLLTMKGIMDVFDTMDQDIGSDEIGKEIWGNFNSKRIWNSIFGASVIKQRDADSRRGSVPFDEYVTDLGTFKFFLNKDMPNGELIAWDPDRDVEQLHYRGGQWATGVYATQGWYETGFLRSDKGLKWNNPRYRARFTNFNTTLTAYSGVDAPH